MTRRTYMIIGLILVLGCGPKKGITTKKKDQSKAKEVIDARTTSAEDSSKTVDITRDKPKPQPKKAPSSTEAYIQEYAPIAQNQMRSAKIPASIILAQGILESGSGRGRLAIKANNHFGIKCHGWKGATIYHDDDRSQECFRKYKRPESSYKDHSDFLTGRKRYAKLFDLKPDDYKGWAKGLRAAGYATDRKYPQKLISLIERYELYQYDEAVLDSGTSTKRRKQSTHVTYTVVQGDTLYSLARRYGTTVSAIKNLNKMTTDRLDLGQELLIPN
jgi:flagellum-specific peptidoglycan hydrolase FlgJ